jgi:transposase-like protein
MTREGREVWAKRVERWRDSGLTLKEFAAEIGVNANTLAGWRWRLSSRDGVSPVASGLRAPAFLEIVAPVEADEATVTPAVAPEVEPLEIVLRSGHCVRVPARFDEAALRRVVAALEAR